MIVTLARNGDRDAFSDLIRRKQSSIRHLMRRCCNDVTLADDLAQQVFLQAWLKIHTLKQAVAFSAWLKRLAITVWLQTIRKKDPLWRAEEVGEDEIDHVLHHSTVVDIDLDQALATLPEHMRLCIVLSYHEGLSHQEIAEIVTMPLGTVKSHINRGTRRLQQILAVYSNSTSEQTETGRTTR